MSMGFNIRFIYSTLWISLLFQIPKLVYCIDKELPSFEELPPPVQYYSTGVSHIELRCKVWPNNADIQFVVSSKKQWQGEATSRSISINPLDKSFGQPIAPGYLKISSEQLSQIHGQDIHCLAGTDFGKILSRPFRVAHASMSNFGGGEKVTKKEFLIGNIAYVDCIPPESHPKADVKFIFNDQEIKEGGKYRIVQWSEQRKMTLLIKNVNRSDSGKYQCHAINRVTNQVIKSPEVIQLIIESPQETINPSIVMPISGRSSGPLHITARPGSNVTLFCIIRGSPPSSIKVYSTSNPSSQNPRFKHDNSFGLLDIINVQQSDGGSYMCSDNFISSTAVFKVIEPLSITETPLDIVMDSFTGHATFSCKSNKPNSSPTWLFNGRPITANYNSSTIQITEVSLRTLGLYQCIIQDLDEWVSAAATLSTKSYRLISRPPLEPSSNIKPPIQQNIDNEGKIFRSVESKRIFYNLAVFLKWSLNPHELGDVSYYVVEISHRVDESTWSVPVTLQKRITDKFIYVTDKVIQPQNKYRFRVHAFFKLTHTVTSIWTNPVLFMDVGNESPIIEELKPEEPDQVFVRWSYADYHKWQVNTFRILYRQVFRNATEMSKYKYSKYLHIEIRYPAMNVTVQKLEPGATYQFVVLGLYVTAGTNTSTKYSESRMVSLPINVKKSATLTPQPSGDWFKGLWDSWKSNKVLYGSLFALTGLMLLIMFLLLLLCLCRQRKFRSTKGMGSTNAFPYNYKEVSKTSAINNSSSTLQIPGRIPQHSNQLALQQYQHNNGSLDRRNTDTSSQIYRAGSVQAMETASLVTDLYGNNYMHGMQMNHMQNPYQGFSTLQPQNYPSNHGRSVPPYQHYLQQQQQQQQQQQLQQQQHHAQMGSLLRENPAGDSNRDSITEQSIEMAQRNMPNSAQNMRQYMGYYDQRQGAMSPQMMMMMMGSQQSLANSGQYRRSNSQNYSLPSVETPIAINPSGHPIYQMDQVLVDTSGRPISPQYHYMQQQQQQLQHQQQQQQLQQQQQQQQHHHHQPGSHLGQMHPSMMDMYSQPHAFSRPITAEYQQSLNRQQYRRSDSDCGTHEPGYSYLPTPHGPEVVSSRQHTLNSLPEQPMDNNNHDQHDSPVPIIANSSNSNINNNNSSSGRHHHRRKTRSRQTNNQEPTSLERSQVMKNHNDIPPMLAPRTKLPYSEHQGIHRLSAHEMNTIDSRDNAVNDCNSESNTAGAVSDNFDPPLQYSGHYDTNESKYRMDCNIDMNENEATPSNSLLIENLPRVRDVSEYGIPINNNNHNMKQAPVPPLKSNSRHNPVPNNSYGLECNPDYYSSATSSDRSGPSPPPKYAPGVVLPARADEIYMRDQREGMYYHGDTHC